MVHIGYALGLFLYVHAKLSSGLHDLVLVCCHSRSCCIYSKTEGSGETAQARMSSYNNNLLLNLPELAPMSLVASEPVSGAQLLSASYRD